MTWTQKMSFINLQTAIAVEPKSIQWGGMKIVSGWNIPVRQSSSPRLIPTWMFVRRLELCYLSPASGVHSESLLCRSFMVSSFFFLFPILVSILLVVLILFLILVVSFWAKTGEDGFLCGILISFSDQKKKKHKLNLCCLYWLDMQRQGKLA